MVRKCFSNRSIHEQCSQYPRQVVDSTDYGSNFHVNFFVIQINLMYFQKNSRNAYVGFILGELLELHLVLLFFSDTGDKVLMFVEIS